VLLFFLLNPVQLEKSVIYMRQAEGV